MSEDLTDFLQWAERQGLLPSPDEAMGTPEFVVDSDQLALWACRVIEAGERTVKDREATMRAEVDKLQAWVEEAQRRAAQTRAFMEAKLHAYLLAQQREGKLGRHKSLSLPGGRRLALRMHATDYEITDADAFLAWCRDQGFVKDSPRWGEARKTFRLFKDQLGAEVGYEQIDQETGEVTLAVVPGVRIGRTAGERFGVTIATDEPIIDEKVGG